VERIQSREFSGRRPPERAVNAAVQARRGWIAQGRRSEEAAARSEPRVERPKAARTSSQRKVGTKSCWIGTAWI